MSKREKKREEEKWRKEEKRGDEREKRKKERVRREEKEERKRDERATKIFKWCLNYQEFATLPSTLFLSLSLSSGPKPSRMRLTSEFYDLMQRAWDWFAMVPLRILIYIFCQHPRERWPYTELVFLMKTFFSFLPPSPPSPPPSSSSSSISFEAFNKVSMHPTNYWVRERNMISKKEKK